MNLLKTSTPIDWSALLGALIVLALSIIISVLLILGSQHYRDQMTEWERQQHSEHDAIGEKYSRLQQALDIVNGSYLETFNQLIEKGFFLNEPHLIVEEQRLKMFGQIKTLLPQLELITADYTFLEKRLYNFHDVIMVEPEFKTYETQLILKLELLHEGDILTLIETIEYQQFSGLFSGLFNLQSCDIKRLSDKINVKNVNKPYFNANCILAWYISKIETDR